MQNRINNSNDLVEAEQILAGGGEVVVQFSGSTYLQSTLEKLNVLAEVYKDRIEIRFYGHYSSTFDFNAIRQIPNVRNLSVDCLQNASNIEVLRDLQWLNRLSIGVYNGLPEDLLSYTSLENLGSLVVSESKQKKLNLSYLSKFHRLHELYLVGQTRSIETVGSLPNLRRLSLAQIGNKQSLGFLNSLESLRKLTILLGGRENLNEISLQSLEELEVLRVRGVSELNPGAFPGLKRLRVEDQIRLKEISFGGENPDLQNLVIGNCKELTLLNGLSRLSSLERLRIYQTSLDFDWLVSEGLPRNLRDFSFYGRTKRVDDEIQGKLGAMGYQSRGV